MYLFVGLFSILLTFLQCFIHFASQMTRLWKLRCLNVFQSILEENSSSIHEEFLSVAEKGKLLFNCNLPFMLL